MTDSPTSETRSRRVLGHFPVIVCAAAIAVIASYWFVFSNPAPQPPAVPTILSDEAATLAITSARDHVVASRRDGAAWGRLALLFRRYGLTSEAEVCLEQAELLDPDEVMWPYMRGAYLAATDLDSAMKCFRRAAEHPRAVDACHFRLADFLLEQRQLKECSVHVERGLKLAPTSSWGHQLRARLAYQSGDYQAALRSARQAVQGAPQVPAMHELLARIYHRLGNAEAARSHSEALLQLNKDVGFPDPFAERAENALRSAGLTPEQPQDVLAQGRLGEAMAMLERASARAGDDTAPHLLLAMTLVRVRDYGRAAAVLDATIAKHPDSAEVRFQRGVVHFLQSEFDGAVANFQAALERKPDYAHACYNLGHALKELDDNEAAIVAFRNTVRFQPTYVEAHLGAAELLLNANRRDEAMEHLNIARRLAPSNDEVVRLLSQAQSPNP